MVERGHSGSIVLIYSALFSGRLFNSIVSTYFTYSNATRVSYQIQFNNGSCSWYAQKTTLTNTQQNRTDRMNSINRNGSVHIVIPLCNHQPCWLIVGLFVTHLLRAFPISTYLHNADCFTWYSTSFFFSRHFIVQTAFFYLG